jgi:hypothetical protein
LLRKGPGDRRAFGEDIEDMPNLLPDWHLTLPWGLGLFGMREAGRLIWFSALLTLGVMIVILLIMPPLLKRPFPKQVGYAAFPAMIIGGLILTRFLPDIVGGNHNGVQRIVALLVLGALAGHTLLMVASREPRDPNRETTWAESYLGAVGVFALFVLGYAIVPHEWLEFANAQLEWGDSGKLVFSNSDQIFGIVDFPFNFDFPAMRDIVVTGIYATVLVANLIMWSKWQRRFEVKAPTEGETAPARRSRFGRPLRRTEPAPAAAATEGA